MTLAARWPARREPAKSQLDPVFEMVVVDGKKTPGGGENMNATCSISSGTCKGCRRDDGHDHSAADEVAKG